MNARTYRRRLYPRPGLCAALGVAALVVGPGQAQRAAAGSGQPRKILFASGRRDRAPLWLDIFTMNDRGAELTNLTQSDAIEFDPVWSPDGKHIAYSVLTCSPEAGGKRQEWQADIHVMRADGTERQRLTHTRAIASCPTWSPDGKRIAFCEMPHHSPDPARLYLMDADGRNRRQLGEGFMPAWSPDGKHILYTADLVGDEGAGSTFTLFVLDVENGSAKRLTHGDTMMGAWSPDGQQIAFVSDGVGDMSDISVINADGSSLRHLTHSRQVEECPQWSADGKHILFARSPAGLWSESDEKRQPRSAIYSMDLEGRHVRRLTSHGSISLLRGEPATLVIVGELIAALLSLSAH